MKFSRVNNNTISCIISKEELEGSGLTLEDIIGRKVGAMEYLHRVILEAARQEHLQMNTGYTSMQIQVGRDGSLVLTISNGAPEDTAEDSMKAIRDAIESILSSKEENVLSSAKDEKEPVPNIPEGTESRAENSAELEDGAGDVLESDKKADSKISGYRQFGYRFYAAADAAECCRKLPQLAKMDTSLWLSRNGDYYLIVSSKENDVLFEKTILAMNEFGTFVDAKQETVDYIMEHEKCILEKNAAAQLIQL